MTEWIPCSERLPEDIRPVLVTWKNNDPASYYQYIVGKHFIGTAHYHRGKWYWYSSVTEDLLAEYGKCDGEEFDEAIEVVAWMPLPKPWKGADDEYAIPFEALGSAPSIDIVRCQDCKYWVYNFNGCARNPCTEPWYATDYCNYGERKERE